MEMWNHRHAQVQVHRLSFKYLILCLPGLYQQKGNRFLCVYKCEEKEKKHLR